MSVKKKMSKFCCYSDNEDPILANNGVISEHSPFFKLERWQRLLLVGVNILFVVFGQSTAVLLGRFYYNHGGNSRWLATLVQSAAFPILFVPLILLPSSKESSTSHTSPIKTLALIYLGLGVVIGCNNMLFSTGLLYLSASTYSIICATQLAFNAIFSYFINSQKFTIMILNSAVLLSLSASLIGLNDDSAGPSGVSRGKYTIGFICTLTASAIYSLILSLIQLTSEKVVKKETFSAVLSMQIGTSLFATCVTIVALFASGEWKNLHGEMEGFGTGKASYVMTLVGTAVAWQVCAVGVLGLIFLVSSLFSNVIGTVSMTVSPIAAVIVFGDKMNGVKVIAMLLSIWGFASYIYQNYLDDAKVRKTRDGANAARNDSSCC